MKVKKFENKLTLNKETIADLNKREMSSVHGGTRPVTCVSVPIPQCTQHEC